MLKEQYRHMMDQMAPEEALVQSVLEGQGENGSRKRRRIRPGVTAVAAVLACILLATPVMAATLEPFRAILYAVSPATAQYFTPVQKSCEDNGIRMEVVASYIHGDTAELYVSLQDLTGDRIDETTDLFDSYDIRRPYDNSATCSLVDYDEDTRTATFLISITEWNNHRIAGSKITFTVREFLSHKQIYEDVEIPVDLTALGDVETQQVEPTGGSGTILDGKATALIPGVPRQEFPVEGIDLTAIGYVDGKLHVQMALKNCLETDNHGWFYLVDENGNPIDSDGGFYFRSQDDGEGRTDYLEVIFSIPQEEIGNYTLSGYFVTCDTLTKGNWRVTFPLTNME